LGAQRAACADYLWQLDNFTDGRQRNAEASDLLLGQMNDQTGLIDDT